MSLEQAVPYAHGDTAMHGMLVAPVSERPSPSVLLVHGAYGLTRSVLGDAHRLADLGFAVLAADVWGRVPAPGEDPGPLVGGMAADRVEWHGRLTAALDALRERPEAAGRRPVVIGTSFGGASALELVRTGAEVSGAVSIAGGLDLVGDDWSSATASARVLLCTGADDPMAPAAERARIEGALSQAGLDWEVDLFGGAGHGYTDPPSPPSRRAGFGPHPRSAARTWQRIERFLQEDPLDH
ncbi:dienelactone hydrolase family protein [Microbacterium oryzae]|uniref:dienelactone hydrolase family protein n=1 Tax=Microbacterium oryzae TaxID=743009 RepID=UPI0025B07B58|nr:dienelactone hydrolase family protein [Microbacterium oryzae]MDN3310335.1 dienelactone hydrolase family protein [Microbacterium oryzae]